MDNHSVQYGNDRLISFIREHAELTPDDFATALDQDLAAFTGNAPQSDDITLVVIKEKIMVDELILEKRKRLLQMVEQEGVPIEEACKQMGVSVGTFYKYRKRWQEQGDSGLLNKKLRADENIRQLSYNARKRLLDVIRENPEVGAGRIKKLLEESGEVFSTRSVYDELVNMRLNTKVKRLAYVDRVGQLKPEQKELLEKELLREERKEVDRNQYAEGLKKNIENRQAEKMAQETGRIISQLKQVSPAEGKENLFKEIAKELGKLDGGAEMAQLFQSLVTRIDDKAANGSIAPESSPPAQEEAATGEPAKQTEVTEQPAVPQMVPSKPVEVAPASDAAIDIEKRAIKHESAKNPLDNFDEYEKKLANKFKK
jgi:transposase